MRCRPSCPAAEWISFTINHPRGSTGGGALGIGLVTGLAISLWSANQGIKALFDSLNTVYGEHEKRGFFGRTALTLCFTAGALLVILLAMAFVVGLPVVLGFSAWGFRAESAEPRSMARSTRRGRAVSRAGLSLRTEPQACAMAVGHMGERVRSDRLGNRLRGVLLVRRQFRELQ